VAVSVPATARVLPDPTLRPTLVPVPAAANNASTESRSELILVPQVSVDAPTSGLVKSRFVVVVSAMIYLYAATCHVVALSEISDHVSDVSDSGVQISDVSGIAPHPNPRIVPTAPIAPFPDISIAKLFSR